jgi:hypothetical protein
VRHAKVFFLQRFCHNNPLHEDSAAVVATLTKLTTRSLVMMTELRHFWYLLDIHDIRVCPHYTLIC